MRYDVAQIVEHQQLLVVLTEPWQASVQAVEANGFASSNPQQLAECHYE